MLDGGKPSTNVFIKVLYMGVPKWSLWNLVVRQLFLFGHNWQVQVLPSEGLTRRFESTAAQTETWCSSVERQRREIFM